MRWRALTALMTATTLAASSCGGGGDSGPSKAEFRAELEEICSDTTRAAKKVDVPSLSDPAEFEDFAQDLTEVLENTKADLAALEAPDELAADFSKLKKNVDDQIEALEDVEKAAKDEDADDVVESLEELSEIQEERADIADDLDVEECKPERREAPETTEPVSSEASTTVTTVPSTLPPETDPPSTTAAPTVAPTVAPTLPISTVPPRTDPPETDPPETDPPETAPPDTGVTILFDILDLPAEFNPFDGFTLGPPDTAFEQFFIEGVANNVLLNLAIEEMGVANILDADGELVAYIVIGFARNEELGVPNAWKDQDCPPEQALPHETPDGFFGVYCDFRTDTTTSLFEVFSATTTELGFTIATVVPIDIDVLVDGFLEANI